MEFTIPSKWINRPLNIVVVGAGGTGSAMISELFQMSFLLNEISEQSVYFNVSVYDDDDVSFANVGRQSYWSNDVGLNKAEALVDRFNTYGNVKWTAYPTRFKHSYINAETMDLLITCTDSAKTRAEIGKHGQTMDSSLLWLDLGNDKDSSQCILGWLGKAPCLLPNVFELYPQLASIVDDETESCSHIQALAKQDYGVNKSVALAGTQLLWQLIRHSKISHHGAFINLKDGTQTPLPIDPLHWSMLGLDTQAKQSN